MNAGMKNRKVGSHLHVGTSLQSGHRIISRHGQTAD
jgi:hypothetical protein